MDVDTLRILGDLQDTLKSQPLDKQKKIICEQISTLIGYNTLAWITRKDFNRFIDVEQAYLENYSEKQIADYRANRHLDEFLEFLTRHPGKAMTLREVVGNPATHKMASFTRKHSIDDCLGMLVFNPESGLNHLISIHLVKTVKRFTNLEKRLFESLVSLYVSMVDFSILSQSKFNWIFDVNGEQLSSERTSELFGSTFAKGIALEEEFSLVPKDALEAKLREVLSPSEAEVAKLTLFGLSNKRIALNLNKSPSTVAKQLTSTFSKFGVSNRNQLMAKLG